MSQWDTPDPIALHARGQPGRLACRDIATDRRWRYAELDRNIQQAVAWLQQQPAIHAGERIAVIARNSADLLILNIAAERLGAIFVPLNYRLSTAELTTILADCQPRLVAMDHREQPPTLPAGARSIDTADLAGEIAACPPSPRLAPLPGDLTKIILYTSGTSGRPKGVMITGENIYATAVNFGLIGHVSRDSVFLCDAPMFHVIGLLPSIRAPLLFGGALHVAPGFDPQRTNALLADAETGTTHYFCVPKMAAMLTEQTNFEPSRWHHLRALFTGGSPISPHQVRWWLERGIQISNGFGMTEAGTIMHVPLEPGLIDQTAGGVGLPPPFVAIRLVDAEENDVAPGEPGEILVRGPNVTPGYWNRPEETARAFTHDGWLRTGDIGQADARGHMTIKDRKKDMFISGGENVFPAEVENALLGHADVSEAAVVGIADDTWGEVGHAYIVPAPGAHLDPDALSRYCRTLLAGYKVPKRFHIIDVLPRNASGKLMKTALKKQQ
ncbi:AMP-binding protein [Salinisphaera sp. SWV1]|uniref:AMP-binding protein n=1 Tax=Salinisphaera sp. SWV1 TaxID=3454139 RepID=UPI003F85E617